MSTSDEGFPWPWSQSGGDGGDTFPHGAWPWPWRILTAGEEVPFPFGNALTQQLAGVELKEEPIRIAASGLETVSLVTGVSLLLAGVGSPDMYLAAVGETPTLGWKDAALLPWYYIVPPADGIYDFDLVGAKPGEIGLDAVGSVIATFPLGNRPETFRGVRIHPGGVESLP